MIQINKNYVSIDEQKENSSRALGMWVGFVFFFIVLVIFTSFCFLLILDSNSVRSKTE